MMIRTAAVQLPVHPATTAAAAAPTAAAAAAGKLARHLQPYKTFDTLTTRLQSQGAWTQAATLTRRHAKNKVRRRRLVPKPRRIL